MIPQRQIALSSLFLRHLPAATARALATRPRARLEADLQRLLNEGRASWPGLSVTPAEFIAFLARNVAAEAGEEGLGPLRARDLYLVCGYALGRPAALDLVETTSLSKVRRALARLGTPEATTLDILQELRRRLVEMGDPASGQRGYSGRGDLTGWLTLCAVRAAGKQRSDERREPAVEQATLDLLPATGADPELRLLVGLYKAPFQAAFQEALASLTGHERNLLRYHFLTRLSIDEVARIYRVHRATAARRIVRAQEQLATVTRAGLRARVPMNPESVTRIVAVLRSHLSLSLAGLLAEGVEVEHLPVEPVQVRR